MTWSSSRPALRRSTLTMSPLPLATAIAQHGTLPSETPAHFVPATSSFD